MRLRLLLILFLLPLLLSAQDADTARTKKPKHHYLRLDARYGNVMQTNNTVKGENSAGEPIKNYFATSLEFGKKTDGSRLWERVYNFPEFGFGLYGLYFLTEAEDFGQPSALYGFFNGPFIRGKKGSFNYNLGFGLSYNWNPFDPDQNTLQTAIGSYRNVYIDAGITYTWYLSKRLDLDIGTSFTHFSNGASSVPNKGINLTGYSIGLKYDVNANKSEPIVYDKGVIPNHDDHNEFYFMAAIGSRNVKSDSVAPELGVESINETYPMATIQFVYQRQFAWKSKAGGGIDVMYDGSLAADADLSDGRWDGNVSYSFAEGLSVGIVGSYELVISRLSIIIQPGYELIRTETPDRPGKFYQRAGVKYHFKNDMLVGINIHAIQFSVARYIEWNLGYRIKWGKNG